MSKAKFFKVSAFAFEAEDLVLKDQDDKVVRLALSEIPELAGLSSAELSAGEIIAGGLGLRWSEFDLDLFLTPLASPEVISSALSLN